MQKNFSRFNHVELALAAQGSGATVLTGSTIDLATIGARSIAFLVELTTYNAGNGVSIEGSDDGTTWSALTSSANSTATAAHVLLDCHWVPTRYVRIKIDRTGAATATGPAYFFGYNARSFAVDHGSDVAATFAVEA